MSDEPKKPEKEFFDEKTGIIHGSECPKTKKEFGEGGDGDCKLESFMRNALDAVRKAVPYQPDLKSCEHNGPTKVNSSAYREGHDRIFGTKPTVGQA